MNRAAISSDQGFILCYNEPILHVCCLGQARVGKRYLKVPSPVASALIASVDIIDTNMLSSRWGVRLNKMSAPLLGGTRRDNVFFNNRSYNLNEAFSSPG